MSVTKIMLFNDAAEAQAQYAYYGTMPGNNVMLVGPADIVRTSGEAPSKIEWDSGDAVDWYMLVVTPAPVLVSGNNVIQT